ncbi:MAG TPA: hypothetical protein VGG08_04005 [Solirubrobacteraceae bacterium]|jgi:hypothetical protein
MISSEVQRTLVKSPPELWAELSDPETLARHLGELGEIKITRVEPERLVEWEATGTTGSVAIRASGWGTKVTLSVTRELSAAQAEPEESEQQTTAEAAEAVEVEEPVEAGVVAEPTDEIEPSEERDSGARTVSEPVASEEEVEVEPASEQTEPTEPAVVTAPLAEEPQIALTAADRFSPDFPGSLREERRQEIGTVEPPAPEATMPEAATPETAMPEAAPVKKPGFFARLFGRKQSRAAEPEGATAPAEPVIVRGQPAPPPTIPPTPGYGAAAIAAVARAHAPAPAQPPGFAEPEKQPVAVEPEAGPVGPELKAEIDSSREVATPAETTCATSPVESTDGEETGVVADAPSDEPSTTDERPAADLAAELRAAEEQVTAVLTGVLDRLGAAHHRPFSRS